MSPEQKDRVLAAIAGQADTLNKLLMVLQAEDDEWAVAVLVAAAQALAEKLGAMADDAISGDVIGDMNEWFYGPNFKARGVEA